MSNVTPSIYVACLASYNNGILHGKWIDIVDDADAIMDEIKQMLKSSPIDDVEEFAIHDFEGFFNVKIEEYQSIESIIEIAQMIRWHGELGAMLLNYYDNDILAVQEALDDCYMGEFTSEEDFARELFDECHEIPEYLQSYIDYDQVANDLFIDDYISFNINNEVHVFRNE